MNRDQKAELVNEITGRYASAPFVVLADYKGSTVAQMDALRRACEKEGIHIEVIKNTLSKRAIAGTSKETLAPHFKGNIAVIFSGEDAIAAAKLVKAQAKENDKLKIRAGFFDGAVLDAKGVELVSTLPSKEQLQSNLLALLLEAPRQVMGVIQGPGRDLVYLLSNFANKLDQG